jgi:hypothetical protein
MITFDEWLQDIEESLKTQAPPEGFSVKSLFSSDYRQYQKAHHFRKWRNEMRAKRNAYQATQNPPPSNG